MEILYIEDDDDDIELFQEALSRMDANIKLISAYSFSDALTKLSGDVCRPDAIFVDYHLPGLDGYQCVKDLKNDEALKYTPIILISSTITSRQVDDFNKLGVYYFLSKTALLSDLEPALKVIIDSLCKGQENK
ncbi:response regulator [Chryseolinea sp. H1M3-3]|uniref:response regulator n=1 Tax=Chryseolinea sp. H1M3-3 TaxID=3034144 RepID=UPI0023EA98F1|nr:response regulator [Chryseolinea sp. H1M3-3]